MTLYAVLMAHSPSASKASAVAATKGGHHHSDWNDESGAP